LTYFVIYYVSGTKITLIECRFNSTPKYWRTNKAPRKHQL